MFTGIIEKLGTVAKVEKNGGNLELYVASDLASELKIDQSVAHNGICLTVVEIFGDRTYRVTAIEETIAKTAIGDLQEGDPINLERCMTMGARLDGHIVQGHVDQIGECTSIKEEDGSWIFSFSYDPSLGNVTVEKGSITVNGTSLTVVDSVGLRPIHWQCYGRKRVHYGERNITYCSRFHSGRFQCCHYPLHL